MAESQIKLVARRLGARITLTGLQKAHPPEYYRRIPSWVNPDDVF